MSSAQESGPLIDSDVKALNDWVVQLSVLFTFFGMWPSVLDRSSADYRAGLHACFYFISAYLLMCASAPSYTLLGVDTFTARMVYVNRDHEHSSSSARQRCSQHP